MTGTGKLQMFLIVVLGLFVLSLGTQSWAQGTVSTSELAEMRKRLDAQDKKLLEQQGQLQDQRRKLEELEKNSQNVSKRVDTIAEAEGVEPKPNDMRVYWKGGPVLETRDKKFKAKFGGRIMWDVMAINQDSGHKAVFGDLQDGTEFRRIRFYMAGKLFGLTEYKLQVDFANSSVALKDAYLRWKVGRGKLTAGHFKEPFGLEEITSSKYITLMERSIVTEAFSPSRNVGIGYSATALEERMTWAAGVFKVTDGGGMALADSGYDLTGRVTGLPWYEDKGKKLLHVGAAASFRNPAGDSSRFRSRPEMHLTSVRFVDTGSFASQDSWLLGGEAAVVVGPFSVQSEVMYTDVDIASSADFWGYYIQASYFVTGEHRPYKKSAGAFSRVKPNNNLGADGWGAFELAARYSHLDLNDSGIMGGELDNITLGVNWYLNPHTRIMVNYVLSDVDGVGDADMIGTRFQVDF